MIVEAPYPIREYQEALRKAGEKELADCAAMIRDKEIVFDTKLSVVETITLRICDLINEEAKRWPADLIVIRHPWPTRIQSFSSR
jgi:nucleotide-binding universal stress UspA family protein